MGYEISKIMDFFVFHTRIVQCWAAQHRTFYIMWPCISCIWCLLRCRLFRHHEHGNTSKLFGVRHYFLVNLGLGCVFRARELERCSLLTCKLGVNLDLRILAMYELKMSKNDDSPDVLLDNFVNNLSKIGIMIITIWHNHQLKDTCYVMS